MAETPPAEGGAPPSLINDDPAAAVAAGTWGIHEVDLSAGDELDQKAAKRANMVLDDSRARLYFRLIAVAGVVGVVSSLVIALLFVVVAFTTQVKHVVPAIDVTKAVGHFQGGTLPPTAASAAIPPASGASAVAARAQTNDNPVRLTTNVSIDLASMASSIVAIITVLVVALVVLSLGMLRSTFSLTTAAEERDRAARARHDPPRPDTDKASGSKLEIPLPTLEFFKEMRAMISDLLKART